MRCFAGDAGNGSITMCVGKKIRLVGWSVVASVYWGHYPQYPQGSPRPPHSWLLSRLWGLRVLEVALPAKKSALALHRAQVRGMSFGTAQAIVKTKKSAERVHMH